ncbi:MAG: hypothetical protein IPG89_19595 [Bacteroidetes bacterium]|jgi:hypothetical protein|nr:hypothetical protein [Bacteroidota bacterium]
MFDLKKTLDAISAKWKYKLDELSPGVYRMDVALKIDEDNWRYQFVNISQVADRYFGEPAVLLTSRCGEYSTKVDLYLLLKEAGLNSQSTFTVIPDKRENGSPCEAIICQAAIPVECITEALLDKTLYEVAFNADLVEEKYFGGDGN